MTPHEVFLSHAAADKEVAARLTDVLRRHGVPVWYSATNIGAALKRCDGFLLLLSPNAVRSFWVKRELAYALEQPGYVNRITPVLVTACDFERLSWTLSAMQFVDFTSSFDQGCRDLLRVWGIGYKTL